MTDDRKLQLDLDNPVVLAVYAAAVTGILANKQLVMSDYSNLGEVVNLKATAVTVGALRAHPMVCSSKPPMSPPPPPPPLRRC